MAVKERCNAVIIHDDLRVQTGPLAKNPVKPPETLFSAQSSDSTHKIKSQNHGILTPSTLIFLIQFPNLQEIAKAQAPQPAPLHFRSKNAQPQLSAPTPPSVWPEDCPPAGTQHQAPQRTLRTSLRLQSRQRRFRNRQALWRQRALRLHPHQPRLVRRRQALARTSKMHRQPDQRLVPHQPGPALLRKRHPLPAHRNRFRHCPHHSRRLLFHLSHSRHPHLPRPPPEGPPPRNPRTPPRSLAPPPPTQVAFSLVWGRAPSPVQRSKAPQALVRRTSSPSQFGTQLGLSLEITPSRHLYPVHSSQADGVWRVSPVGTGRRLRNGRVA